MKATIEQQEYIENVILEKCCASAGPTGIHIDDWVSYDDIIKIADCLKTQNK